MKKILVIILMFLSIAVSLYCCTIFNLVDDQNVIFCNNEDWKSKKTRIWFIPKSDKKNNYGCVFVGFSNQWAQGGMNTEGLAFDWVAGYNEDIERKANQKKVRGNPAEKMLKTCRNIDEAIEFFINHWEPGFAYARIMVADSSGKSAIIRAKEGKVFAERYDTSYGFGYGYSKIENMINIKPDLSNARELTEIAEQKGKYGTKYSNYFDLKNKMIYIVDKQNSNNLITLNLYEELEKGNHYYDISKIEKQLNQDLKKISLIKEGIKKLFF